MTFTCYEPHNTPSVMGIDLQTKQVTDFLKRQGRTTRQRAFPDGLYTAVEVDRKSQQVGCGCGSSDIDIWKLKLHGKGKHLVRLTDFNHYEGGKASNPVVSTDGRFVAFQAARANDSGRAGYEILLYWFKP